MSCNCCLVENGLNIVLELVTIIIAGVLLLGELFVSGAENVFMICCNIGMILACIFGILALKRQHNRRLGWATVCLGAAVFLPFVILLILMIIATPGVLAAYANVNELLEDNGKAPQSNLSAAESRGFLIAVLVFVFAYLLFGAGTSLALAVKHYRILRKPPTSNAVVVGTTTVHYIPPSQQPGTNYYADMPHPHQPGQHNHQSPYPQQPPPYSEKNKSDMV